MKINEIYQNKFLTSFEIFPPKTEEGKITLFKEIGILANYYPGFISVTYGAGGSTREKTLNIALEIRKKYDIIPLVHFTCVDSSRKDLENYLHQVKMNGIQNILALRGDPPVGQEKFIPHPGGFSHANELVEFIKSINGFTIAVAGYPEGHTEAPDLDTDIDNLRKKVDAGADFIITQLFYNNDDFYNFIDKISKKGIQIPVIPGIMPVTSFAQIKKITKMCGASIPEMLTKSLRECKSETEICEKGIDYSIKQCKELKAWGVPGFHFYTLNRAFPLTKIMDSM